MFSRLYLKFLRSTQFDAKARISDSEQLQAAFVQTTGKIGKGWQRMWRKWRFAAHTPHQAWDVNNQLQLKYDEELMMCDIFVVIATETFLMRRCLRCILVLPR